MGHVVEKGAALGTLTRCEGQRLGLPFSRSVEDASAISKPCFCVGVFVGGTVHLFRVPLEVLHCSVFSNSRIGNPFRYWWWHVTLSHRKPLFVILNWFPCLIGCSVRSSGCLLIAHAIIWPLPRDLSLKRSCSWYHCSIFMVLGSIPEFFRALVALLWLHDLLIELLVDAVSRGRDGFTMTVFTTPVIVQ